MIDVSIVMLGQKIASIFFINVLQQQKNQLMHERKITTGRELAQNIRRHMAEYEGAKLGILTGVHSIKIIGDSKTTIRKCQTTATNKSVIGAIIKDIQNKKTCFQEIIFHHIQRSENSQAHRLAKEALDRGGNSYLRGEELKPHNRIRENMAKKLRLRKCLGEMISKEDSKKIKPLETAIVRRDWILKWQLRSFNGIQSFEMIRLVRRLSLLLA
ncbi:hypothetical protein PVK06_029737 [Gossypium arboreum]|uniref:RNase H type-1 domain-containing protein n=1 Tax=Gossypium arboreum TaxID=29729 RepID=A0ABR0NLD5_GOSAR|nr:hypothetical protein PVK06_029737 [Gossypium arboreum]